MNTANLTTLYDLAISTSTVPPDTIFENFATLITDLEAGGYTQQSLGPDFTTNTVGYLTVNNPDSILKQSLQQTYIENTSTPYLSPSETNFWKGLTDVATPVAQPQLNQVSIIIDLAPGEDLGSVMADIKEWRKQKKEKAIREAVAPVYKFERYIELS